MSYSTHFDKPYKSTVLFTSVLYDFIAISSFDDENLILDNKKLDIFDTRGNTHFYRPLNA